MIFTPKTKSIGYKSGADAQAARDRLGKGSVKAGTTGTFYHEIEFNCPTAELGKLNEDCDAIAKHLGLTPVDILTAMNNGVYLKARTHVEDGSNPEVTKTAQRASAEQALMDWSFANEDLSLLKDMNAEFKAGGVKAKAAWLDDFIASGGVVGITTTTTL